MSNIFAKSDDHSISNKKNKDGDNKQCLSIRDIKKSIPPNAIKKPMPNLAKTHTEWRWRFFNIDGRKLIEMSCMHPDQKRTFMDADGNWINTNEDELIKFEEFIHDVMYYYAENTD